MKTLSIETVARRTGIRASALRYYEEAGILPAPERLNGRRYYDVDAITRLDVLKFAQQAGFTLDEIKTLFRGFDSAIPLSVRWQKLACAKLQELTDLEAKVKVMKRALKLGLQCGCVRIEDCSLSPSDVTDEGQEKRASKGCSSC